MRFSIKRKIGSIFLISLFVLSAVAAVYLLFKP